MTIQRITSLATTALMLATIGCGSGGGGGTGGTGAGTGGSAATGGSKGTGGAGGVGTGGSTGTGGASATGGSTGTGGAGGGFTATTLLVDNDASDNNLDPTNTSPTPSTGDTLFPTLLAAEQITYDTFAVPNTTGIGPVFSQLGNVSTIIWYTGDNFGDPGTITPAQQTTLENWLDVGNKTLIIFSEDMMYDLGVDWTFTGGNTFVTSYLGLLGGVADVSTALGSLEGVNYTATGNTGVPAFSGLTFAIDANTGVDITTADAVNPATGTDTLLTAPADPTGTGTDSPTPVASGHTKGTSKIIYVGIPIESVHGAPNNTSAQLFHACLKYAGLKTN